VGNAWKKRKAIKMPNQRHPDKDRLRAWMYAKDKDVLRQICEREGIEMGDLLSALSEMHKNEKKGFLKKWLKK
jgi:cytidylate kinase